MRFSVSVCLDLKQPFLIRTGYRITAFDVVLVLDSFKDDLCSGKVERKLHFYYYR
jgi:hypothetical protein